MDTDTQLNSIFAFKSRVFGPKYWFTLFTMVMGSYPVKMTRSAKDQRIKKAFIATLGGLRYTMPCSLCRASYCKFWKDLPIGGYLASRKELVTWLWLIHDRVNQKLGKKSIPLDKVIEWYLRFRARGCSKEKKACI